MPVFISHRTADDLLAGQVASRLQNVHGITCYVDDIDAELGASRRTARVTELIVKRLTACSNLLAIVTENTQGSWWVPFEVGVARQAPRIITSYTNQYDSALPEYLLEWPRLRGNDAVDEFARLYKSQRSTLRESVVEKRAYAAAAMNTVDQFHRTLKARLGQ